MLQASDHLYGPFSGSALKDPCLMFRIPSWMQPSRSHKGKEQGRTIYLILLPTPLLNVVGLLGSMHTWLGHAQLLIHKNPQVLLVRASLNDFSQSVLISGIFPTHMQQLRFGELHEVL